MLLEYYDRLQEALSLGEKDSSLQQAIKQYGQKYSELMRSYQELCDHSYRTLCSWPHESHLEEIKEGYRNYLLYTQHTLEKAFEVSLIVTSHTSEKIQRVVDFHQKISEGFLDQTAFTKPTPPSKKSRRLTSHSTLIPLRIAASVFASLMGLSSASLATDTAKEEAYLTSSPAYKTPKPHFDGRFGNFLHKEAYNIESLHSHGLTGKSYTVSIIEANASVNHPALTGKVEVITPFPFLSTFSQHGNHVSALILGHKTDQFDGGIAPGAKGYVIAKEGEAQTYEKGEQETLTLFEEAAKRAHIINLSGTTTLKSLQHKGYSKALITNLTKILETYDSVLVVSASNDPGAIGENKDLKHLMDLISTPDIAKRVLIVGNLGYENQHSLTQKEAMLKNGSPPLIQALEEHINQANPLIKNIKSLRLDFKYFLNDKKELAEIYEIPEVERLFYTNSPEHLQTFLKGTNDQFTQKAKEALDIEGGSWGLESFLKTNTLDTLIGKVNELFKVFKTLPTFKNYLSNKEQYTALFADINDKINLEEAHIQNAFQTYMPIFQSGWDDAKDFRKKLDILKHDVETSTQRLPFEKQETGHVVSTEAGKAKEHFIMTYGENIRSAWEWNQKQIGTELAKEYVNHTGSSQATPITTGILILLHQYLNVHQKIPTSWVDIIKLAKESARPIGSPEVFGRGMLDTTRLFSPLFK